jgi:hypothetical protein
MIPDFTHFHAGEALAYDQLINDPSVNQRSGKKFMSITASWTLGSSENLDGGSNLAREIR